MNIMVRDGVARITLVVENFQQYDQMYIDLTDAGVECDFIVYLEDDYINNNYQTLLND